MELNQLKSAWKEKVLPTYSADEIEQIFILRTKKTFGRLQNALLKDTLTALILTGVFVAVLFYFEFESRLYWTIGLMGLALTNIIIYSIQSQLLSRSLLYRKDIVTSLKSTKKRLDWLQKFYLIWPTVLAGLLTVIFQVTYGEQSGNILALQTAGTMVVVGALSFALNFFSLKRYRDLIESYIAQLGDENVVKS